MKSGLLLGGCGLLLEGLGTVPQEQAALSVLLDADLGEDLESRWRSTSRR